MGVGGGHLSIEGTQTVLPLVYVQIDFLSQRDSPEPLSHLHPTPMRKFPRRAQFAKRQVTQSAPETRETSQVGGEKPEDKQVMGSKSQVRQLAEKERSTF